ncbi:MAG: hypothetical protein P1S60_09490 [Anaerolineae bacterium]|nr:hypothetical protein [Anaerolineae bacterium]
MAIARLTIYQQSLLCEIWNTIPPAVSAQLTQESVRNVEMTTRDDVKGTGIIATHKAVIER